VQKKKGINPLHTAAMDGTFDRGAPCETSIPKIMVGTLDRIGMAWFLSISKSEFNPPS